MYTPTPIPFGDFAPDLGDYNPAITSDILNVIPKAEGYGPLKSFVTYGTGLPSTCKGGITVRLSDGTFVFYAGTASKLYRYNSGTSSYDDVTRLSGGDYAVPTDYLWSFVQFGPLLIATNGFDDVQSINIDSGSNFAALAGSPPKARFVGTTGEFVVLLALATNAKQMQWSGIGDAEYWTVTQRGSGSKTFGSGGEITGFVGYETGGIVLQRTQTSTMRFAPGSLYSFAFAPVQSKVGSIGNQSIIEFRNTFFFISDGGFYQGHEATPIGDQRVNEYLTDTADMTQLSLSSGAADPINKIAWWIFINNDQISVLIGYHWTLNKWTIANPGIDYLASGATPGYTLDGLDAVSASIDALPYSLDSRVWKGGTVALAAFNTAGDFGFLEGPNLEATIGTNDLSLEIGRRAFVRNARLITDAPVSGYTCKIGTRDNAGATLGWTAALTPNTISGKILARKHGRFHRAKWIIAAGTEWDNATGTEIIHKISGNR